MKTEIEGVDWLLDCEPRPAQLEAIARSYTGKAYRVEKNAPLGPPIGTLQHVGKPARGFCFFMEMRVGKTPTVINEALLFRRDHGIKRLLIISPNRFKDEWPLELTRFGWDGPAMAVQPGKKDKYWDLLKVEGAALVVNYQAMYNDDTMALLAEFVDSSCYVAADESVNIKAPADKSVISRGALEIAKRAGVRRVLSGKPVVQGPHDLYNQLRFVGAMEGVVYHQFKNRHCIKGGFMGKQVVGSKNLDKLEEVLNDYSFRAKRKHWGTALPVDNVVADVTMSKEQRKAYMEMEEEFITIIQDTEITAEQAGGRHQKLQQITTGFMYDEEKSVKWICPFDKTNKYKDLKDRLATEISGKVIIAYLFRPTGIALVQQIEKDFGFSPAFIGGDRDMKLTGRNPQEEKARFNTDDECKVLVAQIAAVKYGFTLMGTDTSPCLFTIFYENSYSLDDRAQTEQRNQGEGQQGNTTIIDYASSRVERRVVLALQRKETVSEAVMEYYKRGDSE